MKRFNTFAFNAFEFNNYKIRIEQSVDSHYYYNPDHHEKDFEQPHRQGDLYDKLNDGTDLNLQEHESPDIIDPLLIEDDNFHHINDGAWSGHDLLFDHQQKDEQRQGGQQQDEQFQLRPQSKSKAKINQRYDQEFHEDFFNAQYRDYERPDSDDDTAGTDVKLTFHNIDLNQVPNKSILRHIGMQEYDNNAEGDSPYISEYHQFSGDHANRLVYYDTTSDLNYDGGHNAMDYKTEGYRGRKERSI